MAVTQNETRDSWLRAPYTTSGYLSTGVQQHPGNGVEITGAANKEAQRFSVAKTQHSYDPAGLAAVVSSSVYSLTPNMRQAYAASVNGTSNNGGRDLDRDRLLPTS